MTTDRDPVVGGVLELVPVPPSTEAFWADLRRRLGEEARVPVLHIVDDPERPEVLGYDRHRVTRRHPSAATFRRRRLVAGIAAAVAAAAAVLAVGALQDDPAGDPVEVGPLDSSTSTPDEGVTTTVPGSPVADAATSWIRAVSAGDAEAAWALVGAQSRDSIGGRAAFDDLMASALREGWGAWDQEGVAVGVVPVTTGGDTALYAVTFTGTIAHEGEEAFRTAVLLVGSHLGTLVVEPFVPGPAVGLLELPLGSEGAPPFAPDDTIGISIDADAAAFMVAIDGAAVPADRLVVDDEGTVRGVRLGGIAPGDHALAVAMVARSGALAAHAATFLVEG